MTYPLITPFGEIIITIDNQEIPYDAIPLEKNFYENDILLGRFAIFVKFQPDQKEHLIACQLKDDGDSKAYIESGERFLARTFYKNDENDMLLIGIEGEVAYYNDIRDSSYDYDEFEVINGVAYQTFAFTQTNFFPFVISWVDKISTKKYPETASSRAYGAELSVEPCFIDKEIWSKAYKGSTKHFLPNNLVFHTWLVGYQYSNNDIEKIAFGEELKFVREPDNNYDSNAIKIVNLAGKKLGYLSRNVNTYIISLMNKGISLSCKAEGISEVEGKRKLFLAIYKDK